MASSGSIVALCLIVCAMFLLYVARPGAPAALTAGRSRAASIPVSVWLMLGLMAFVIPIIEYWMTARSHANGLAGFLPWADATEYFFCSETFLLSLPGADHCAKRPFYIAFFADVLWMSGNRLQVALLLQALLVGGTCIVLVRVLARELGAAAAVAAYATLFLYLAAFASGLVMTENVGVMIGCIAMAVLWRASSASMPGMFVIAMALMGAAVSVRPGPMFILPALMAWYFLCARKPLQSRLIVLVCAVGAVVAAFSLSAIPAKVAGKSLGSTHSNFSYSLYGLVVGGKGWKQVTIDHPEIFNQGLGPKEMTDRVYQAAWHSLQSKPHLFVVGYVRGLGVYFRNQFRHANEFKPLRYPLRIALLIVWILGIWFALQRWREPRYALMLWLQAGLLASAPFIVFDGYSRVFAATAGVDAVFVALGMVWLAGRLAPGTGVAPSHLPLRATALSVLAVAALIGPVIMPLAYRAGAAPAGFKPPNCQGDLVPVVVRARRSTLVLPQVRVGEAASFPLRVRADHFGERFDRWVVKQDELRVGAGTSLLWATRLDSGAPGATIYFKWAGAVPAAGELVGFCIDPSHKPGGFLMTATSMQQLASDP